MLSWLKEFIKMMTIREVFELFFGWLEELAKKTDNKLDDAAIALIRKIIEVAFDLDKDSGAKVTGK